MNKFDEFIEENDRKIDIDTSSRMGASEISINCTSPRAPARQHTVRRSLVQPQVTPGRPSDQEHPLRETPMHSSNNFKFGRSNTLKRKSLILPIISPEATPNEHRQQQPPRTRSISNASYHSRTSSIASEHTPPIGTDMNTLLQVLANKELELLDSKRKIDDIRRTLHQEEQIMHMKSKELHELKIQVSKILNDNVNGSNGFNGNEGTTVDLGKSGEEYEQRPQKKTSPAPSLTPSKKESMWSKPLSLFNQFDQLIQHEIEKKLNWDDLESPKHAEARPKHQDESNLPQSVSPSTPDETNSTDDVLGNVSASLWNFVSDMKTGLLGINEEPEEKEDLHNRPIKKIGSSSRQRSSGNHLRFVASEDERDASPQPDGRQPQDSTSAVELKDYKPKQGKIS